MCGLLGLQCYTCTCIAIFEVVRLIDHRMKPGKFCDDICSGSGVILLTDKQTNRQTNTQTLLKTIPPSLRGCNHVISLFLNVHSGYISTQISRTLK